MKKILLFCFCVMLCSCAHKYTRDTKKASVAKKDYTVAIVDKLNHYDLYIENKTKENIEIDWNKTSFIEYGQTSGKFMFDDVLYINRDNYKGPTIVMPESKQVISIFPNILVRGGKSGLGSIPIPDGERGVYLIFKQGEKEYSEKLLINRTTQWGTE